MAIPFYNQGDQDIYASGDKFIPQEQYRLNYTPSSIANAATTGITNTQAASPYIWPPRGGGGDGGGGGGNIFGYGTEVNPVAHGAYGQPGYSGGLSGDVQQSGWGRQDEPSGGAYLRPQKKLPGIASLAMSLVPGGNLLRRKIEGGMNPAYDPNKNLSGYAVAGLSDAQKGLYDALASGNMLFGGSSGLKTLTGKNFMGKGYLEGQLDIYNQEFANMTEEEINAAIAQQQLNKKGQFKYKKMKEAKTVYDKNKALGDAQDAITARNTFEGGDPSLNQGDGGAYSGQGDTPGSESFRGSDEIATDAASYDLAKGGRIGYADRGFVDEDINIEGPGFDVNEQTAGFIDPDDAMNDFSWEIFNKPFDSLTDKEKGILYDLANEQASAGQDQGLASLV